MPTFSKAACIAFKLFAIEIRRLESDWLSALHAVLDAATIVMELTEQDSSGAAALMHRAGSRTVAHLCDLLKLDADEVDVPTPDAVTALAGRLRRSGYRIKGSASLDSSHFGKVRTDYAGRLASLSRHLGAERTLLVPE